MTTSATLNGTIFYDSNEDGVQQGADLGVAGLLVELFSADGTTLIGSTMSADGGLYSFTGIAPGTYLLMIVPPRGDVFSPTGANFGLPDSTVSPIGAKAVTLTAGAATTVNAGVYSPTVVNITGTVFTDANGDGLMDGTDKGVGGVTVQLRNGSNAVVATTTTAADGTYAFDNVAADTYTQHVVAPAGYTYSVSGGNTPPKPFVSGPSVTAATNLLINGSFEQTTASTTTGLASTPASIQGTLFNDISNNGVEGGDDKGLAGQTVVLYSGDSVVGAAVTDANGNYSFTGLVVGTTYTVQFAAPAASAFSPLGAAAGATDSTVDASGAQSITIGASGGAYTVNAGVHTPLSITGLPASASSPDLTAIAPFDAVSVNVPDPNATTSIIITLDNGSGTVKDVDGLLSGSGLVKTGAGTYSLSASTPAALTAELRALIFTPTAQVAPGATVVTSFRLSATQGAATASATSTLTETATCFLAGTHILTEHGEVAVEKLAPGDSVATMKDGAIVHVPAKWIGGRHLDAAAVRRTGTRPIRIRAGAFCDGVPHRDLLVTPEHCIFVAGSLVPARMLVNDRSVVEDVSIEAFSFYHVELDVHGVLIAEGLTTESYLDTGNRGSFANAPIAALLPDFAADASHRSREHKSWATHACAPLATDRQTVESIWRRLQTRAMECGASEPPRQASLSDDPRLRVLLDDGFEVAARWEGNGRHIFQIPEGARPVRLLSRACAPAQAIGPFVDDRRSLGVQVKSVVFWSGLEDAVMAATDIGMDGWHAPEHGARWTDGAASLDLPRARTSDTFVEVHVVGSMLYREHNPSILLAA